jgi:CheY-like chemotaxis protein
VNKKLLIVEDDVRLREIMRRQLEMFGYAARAVGSGEEALEVAQQEGLDVILLDVNLPGISGFETIDRLRSMPATAAIPVLMLTARDNPEDLLRGYQSGCSYYVAKPFSTETLLRGLQIACG